jgi:DNA invertase Pin-like site-specific DNA recombinase
MRLNSLSKRARGRKLYNSQRKLEVERRRLKVVELLDRMEGRPGAQARIARILEVSESTICRDLKALDKEWRARQSLLEE